MSDAEGTTPLDDPPARLVQAHLRAGWYGLALYIALGILLEAMLAFEVRSYVDVESEQRRMLLRLGHAHGTLLSLVQLGFAFTLHWLGPRARLRMARAASAGLGAGLLLLPLGFLLGGIQADAGDPGVAILLVPVGALCLLSGALCTGWLLRHP